MGPEEIIVTVWKQRKELISKGKQPEKVVMNMTDYRKLRAYHAILGNLDNPETDYLSEERVFDLEIFIDNTQEIKVIT
ncbi:MAG: hypothetical protein ACLFR1_03130 [Spirochaetia bacterium]